MNSLVPSRRPATTIDRLFDDLVGAAFGSVPSAATTEVPIDVRRNDDRFVITFDLPGVDPDSIDVQVDADRLTVTASRDTTPDDGWQHLVRERRGGTLTRQLLLSRHMDTTDVAATYRHGVLTLTVPVADRSRTRRVTVEHGD